MMGKYGKIGSAVAGGALLALQAGTASAAGEAVSGDLGISYNSHFVSYGLDVWGGGTGFYGNRSTTFIYGDLALKATDALTFTFGAWADVNNNVPSAIGGHIQEIDVYPGVSYTFGKATLGLVYNAWSYAGDVEESVDFSLGFNDADLIFPGFAFNPKVVWHYRVSGNGAQTVGSAIVLSVGPSFPLGSGLTLGIPAGLAFFTTKDFQGGTESGYGFSYFGGSLAYSLPFMPAEYGAWAINFDLIAYFTDSKAIPGNVAGDFVTGSMGLKLVF